MIHRGYDIPTIAYFESGNIYHGNIGTFRYRIEKAEDQLRATVWRNDLCYELREMHKKRFSPSIRKVCSVRLTGLNNSTKRQTKLQASKILACFLLHVFMEPSPSDSFYGNKGD